MRQDACKKGTRNMTETTYQDLHYDVVQTMKALEEGEIEHEKAIEQLPLACIHF